MKNESKRYFFQEGQKYDIFNLPENLVIKGDLDISNMELKSLPKLTSVIILGTFNCSCNNLVSLENGPKQATIYDCSNNHLTNLFGAPIRCLSFRYKGNPICQKICPYDENIRKNDLFGFQKTR